MPRIGWERPKLRRVITPGDRKVVQGVVHRNGVIHVNRSRHRVGVASEGATLSGSDTNLTALASNEP
jgi:hypothetical protein